jgi:hypothetical protein
MAGAALLDEVHAVVTRFVAFPTAKAADAVILWTAATHMQAKLEFATRLVVKSPVKRCGKSRLLDVLAPLVRNPLLTSDISEAAQALSAPDGAAETSFAMRLLSDLRDVFGTADKLHGETVLDRLHGIDEAPWANYYGRPLNARDLAALLRPFGVSSADVKIGGVNKRGYYRASLHEAWTHYLPPAPEGSATSATCATSQVNDDISVAGSTQLVLPATGIMPLTSAVAVVAEVADPPLCEVCGQPLNPKLAAAGDTMHPTCDPDDADDPDWEAPF